MQTTAGKIPVKYFRTTFFWPLTLDPPPASSPKARSIAAHISDQRAALRKTQVWRAADELLDHIDPPTEAKDDRERRERLAHSYSEMTFFHEFVQQFLFARHDRGGHQRPMWLFRRTDIARVNVMFRDGDQVILYPLTVERLNLYVLPLGVAILALEVRAEETYVAEAERADHLLSASERGDFSHLRKQDLTLADMLRLNDGFRRAHAPYLVPPREKTRGENALCAPDAVPFAVQWHAAGRLLRSFRVNEWLPGACQDGTRNPSHQTRQGAIAESLRRKASARAIPPFEHFAWLLRAPDSGGGWTVAARNTPQLTWRHMADDRLPVLSCTVLPQDDGGKLRPYQRISNGDWARLCFVDPPGGNAFPYAGAFIRDRWKGHAYDRFHYAAGDSDHGPQRFLISAYSFLAVGSDDGFFDSHVTMHMRRHYFQLMLLAQLERVVLLAVSARISEAVQAYESSNGPKHEALARFEATLQEVEHDFLQYVHRFRFTGVSDQVQPSELFEMLRRNMGLVALYDDIKDELTTATGFLALLNQQRQTNSTARLSVIATFGVILGLAFSLLGMNILGADDVAKVLRLPGGEASQALGGMPWRWTSIAAAVGLLSVTVGLCSIAGLVLGHLAMPPPRDDGAEPLAAKLRQVLRLLGWGGLAFGLALLAGIVWQPLWIIACAILAMVVLGRLVDRWTRP
ncbi:hypothetical protein [Roseomonas sp. AR75]|uniref:hypothetical protein n=1 Tax=Roseomonas sp. AR75 TaxID=2562311 RepID=UPI001485A87F|nr:hypothetical protein [Roseomonas sp. AR75]